MPNTRYPEIPIEYRIATSLAVLRARRNPRIRRWIESVGPDPPESPTKTQRKRSRGTVSDEDDHCSFGDDLQASPPAHLHVADEMSQCKRKRQTKIQKKQLNSDVTDTPNEQDVTQPRPAERRSMAVTRDNLNLLKKPIIEDINKFPRPERICDTLPTELHTLAFRLHAIQSNEKHIMPAEVREEITPYLKVSSDTYFREPVANPTRDTKFQARLVLESVLDVVESAEWLGDSKGAAESIWNDSVHRPILGLVAPLRTLGRIPVTGRVPKPGSAGVRSQSVMTATIAGPWIPTYADGSAIILACSISANTIEDSEGKTVATEDLSLPDIRTRVTSKKVDYVMALTLLKEDPLYSTMQWLTSFSPSPNMNSVNQTACETLRRDLIAVSIETKARPDAGVEAFVQLSIWVAAWHNRMYDLREKVLLGPPGNPPSSSSSQAETEDSGLPSDRLVSVPMIEVIGHNWMLHFACDEVKSIRTYGPLRIGSTESVLEVYKLLSSLEAIRDWIKGTFRERMGEWFGVDNSHLSTRDEGSNRL